MELKYNADYKTGAIKLADALGVGAARRQLGISQKTVYNWCRAKRLAKGEIRGIQQRLFWCKLAAMQSALHAQHSSACAPQGEKHFCTAAEGHLAGAYQRGIPANRQKCCTSYMSAAFLRRTAVLRMVWRTRWFSILSHIWMPKKHLPPMRWNA